MVKVSSLSRLHNQTQTHHDRWDSAGPGISSTQRPLPDNTQLSQEKKSMPPVGFEPTIPACERPQTHALDRAATNSGYTVRNDSATSDFSEGCSRKWSRSSGRYYTDIYLENHRKKSTHLSQGSLTRAEIEHETSRIRNWAAIGWTVMFGDNSSKSEADVLCTSKPFRNVITYDYT